MGTASCGTSLSNLAHPLRNSQSLCVDTPGRPWRALGHTLPLSRRGWGEWGGGGNRFSKADKDKPALARLSMPFFRDFLVLEAVFCRFSLKFCDFSSISIDFCRFGALFCRFSSVFGPFPSRNAAFRPPPAPVSCQGSDECGNLRNRFPRRHVKPRVCRVRQGAQERLVAGNAPKPGRDVGYRVPAHSVIVEDVQLRQFSDGIGLCTAAFPLPQGAGVVPDGLYVPCDVTCSCSPGRGRRWHGASCGGRGPETELWNSFPDDLFDVGGHRHAGLNACQNPAKYFRGNVVASRGGARSCDLLEFHGRHGYKTVAIHAGWMVEHGIFLRTELDDGLGRIPRYPCQFAPVGDIARDNGHDQHLIGTRGEIEHNQIMRQGGRQSPARHFPNSSPSQRGKEEFVAHRRH